MQIQPAPLIFGEVLYDCFPDGREIPGGAPFNVAWNLQAFGLPPLFISRVGDDPRGRGIIEMMTTWSMDTSQLQIDPALPTGRVEILLQSGEPQFTILADQAYDRISPRLQSLSLKPAFLYHGTLALRGHDNRQTLARLRSQLSCPVFVDVNLRDPWWDRELIMSLLAETTWLKLNELELQSLFPDRGTLEECSQMVLERFNLAAIFVTRGSRGAIALTADDGSYSVAPEKSAAVMDTVGAGDAFSSVLLLGLAHNWPLPIIMERAQEFAGAVVGRRGAITRDREFYTSLQENWR